MERKKELFRPLVFYFINTTAPEALGEAAVGEGLAGLKEAGFGGCVVFNKPPGGFTRKEYLSDKWFELIGLFAKAGRKLGLEIWLNDGFDFPPGDAGGRIQQIDPSLSQRMFVRDVSGKIEVNEVSWGFPAFEEPESSSLFIELVYEKYKKHLGEYFGSGIAGFFSDADCRRFGPVSGDELGKRKVYYPSSRKFIEIFRQKYGYKLNMEAVMSGAGGREAEDYWELTGDLYGQWFANNYLWCEKNGLKYTFHTSDTGPKLLQSCRRSSIYTEGRYLKLAREADFPGTDHELLALNGGRHFEDDFGVPEALWAGGPENAEPEDFYDTYGDTRAKYASSAAFLYGKDRVMCEAFAATNWGVDFQKLRQIAAWQIMQGVNLFVLHAWHHRLGGRTKYFAPPDFSQLGALNRGLREFNDWLAEASAMAGAGEPDVETAVLDPTKSVWRGETDPSAFFEACFRLDRMPVEYVVVDEEGLLENSGRFKILVNPGLKADAGILRSFQAGGGTVIDYKKLDSLPGMLGINFKFEGGAGLHYSTRKMKDGRKILLAANICGKEPVAGRLDFGSSSCDIKLEPGEIKALGPKQGKTRQGKAAELEVFFELECAVEWEKDNIIPLSRLEDQNGKVYPIDGGPGRLFFRWENIEEIPVTELLLPKEFCDGGGLVFFDGDEPEELGKTLLFSDEYIKFSSKKTSGTGPHEIEFRPGNSIKNARCNNIYLSGDFAVDIDSTNEKGPLWMEYYNMRLFLPKKAAVRLAARPGKLRFAPWEEQGHPFYSGGASYLSELDLPSGFHSAKLVLPEVRSACSLEHNGKKYGKRIFSPWEFELPADGGGCRVRITVWNTLANMLEGYRPGSGLTSRPFIRMRRK